MSQANRLCPLAAFLVVMSMSCAAAENAHAKPPDPPLARSVAPWATLSLDAPIGGFKFPVQVVSAKDGSKRLFVVEQHGLIRVVKDGKIEAAPFLDATSLLGASGGEQGLLGLAFHPKFKDNGRFFIAYTDKDKDEDEGNAFAEGRVVNGVVDVKAMKVLLSIPDFASNHNGGMLTFGPDGKLWIGTGDGGGGGDPQRTSQDDKSLLGKMLVIDVDANPIGAPTIVHKGLRNPWRYAFDRETGDLWIADVGQNAFEFVFMVDKKRLNEKLNFGWSVVEGAHCFRPKPGCDAKRFERVVFEYPHGEDGCSITGGYVYRGTKSPALVGSYVVGDYCSGRIWTVKRDATSGAFTVAKAADVRLQISSFGEDEDGELWLVDHAGSIRHVSAK